MSRWLELARKVEVEEKSVTDTQQEPAERASPQPQGGFLLVSAGCREEKSTSDAAATRLPTQPASNGSTGVSVKALPNCRAHANDRETLPNAPKLCAACGKSDWRVSLADTDGRHFHVECWRNLPRKGQ